MSKKLGNLVKEARTAKGWTQEALSRKVKGLSASEVSKLERGEWEPTQAVIKEVAKALGVTQSSLLAAATGSGSSSSSKKTSSAKKTSGKTSSAKKTGTDTVKLTASEKKLLAAYKKADSATKKAALGLLEGTAAPLDLITALLKGKTDKDSISSLIGSFGKVFRNGELAPEAASGLFGEESSAEELKLIE